MLITRRVLALLRNVYQSYHNYSNEQRRLESNKKKVELKKGDVVIYHFLIKFLVSFITFLKAAEQLHLHSLQLCILSVLEKFS